MRHPAIRREGPPWLVWVNLTAIVILGAAVAAGGLYLNAERISSDHRAQKQRTAICSLLAEFPEGNPGLDAVRAGFDCGPPHPPRPTPAPTVKVTIHPTPQPRRTITITRPPITRFVPTPMPGPTVTVHRAPRPKPGHTPKRHHHHHPKPNPPSPCPLICPPSLPPLP